MYISFSLRVGAGMWVWVFMSEGSNLSLFSLSKPECRNTKATLMGKNSERVRVYLSRQSTQVMDSVRIIYTFGGSMI